jgi:hypothetical protein
MRPLHVDLDLAGQAREQPAVVACLHPELGLDRRVIRCDYSEPHRQHRACRPQGQKNPMMGFKVAPFRAERFVGVADHRREVVASQHAKGGRLRAHPCHATD